MVQRGEGGKRHGGHQPAGGVQGFQEAIEDDDGSVSGGEVGGDAEKNVWLEVDSGDKEEDEIAMNTVKNQRVMEKRLAWVFLTEKMMQIQN